MRADRLVSIVLLLQAHGRLTVSQMAERLETRERTVRRDLDALSGAGVPVYPQRGRGGGWALLGGHRIDLTGLTAEEAQLLFLATAPASAAVLGPGSSAGLAAARRKVLAALPAPLRDKVEAASNAVVFDHNRWGRRNGAGGADVAGNGGARNGAAGNGDAGNGDAGNGDGNLEAALVSLRRAVLAGRQVVMDYEPPGRPAEERRVHPHGLVNKRGVWYLVASAPAGLRTYRVSRASNVVMTDDAVETPEGFDLAQAWAEVERRLSERVPAGTEVELAVGPSQVRRLRAMVGSWWPVEEDGSWPDGRSRVRVQFPNARVAAAELAALADYVEVLSPDAVKYEMAERGRRLVATYGAICSGE
ncbi:MAG TPA: WYL domain-containing protein [Acidimicrobiales bacterium]|nr:WYL domain-containing protein [Acidimicrobiales bacterium]